MVWIFILLAVIVGAVAYYFWKKNQSNTTQAGVSLSARSSERGQAVEESDDLTLLEDLPLAGSVEGVHGA